MNTGADNNTRSTQNQKETVSSDEKNTDSNVPAVLVLIGIGLYFAKILLWKPASIWVLGPSGIGRETSAATFFRRQGFLYDQAHALDPSNSYVVLVGSLFLVAGIVIGAFANKRVTVKNKEGKLIEITQRSDTANLKLAISSLLLSLAGLILPLFLQIGVNSGISPLQWAFVLILPIAGVVCGHVAKAKVVSNPTEFAGFGMALRGLAVGYGLLTMYFVIFLVDL